MPVQDIYDIGARPPVGEVPPLMHAQVIRPERFGRPADAFKIERVRVPALKPNEVLVCVMAAGINYNNVWAALGQPLNVVDLHKREDPSEDFHIGGSDASGIVYAVGGEVRNVSAGDAVVVHAGYWDANDPYIRAGGDPALSTTMKVWGYETNWGSFAQFCKVQDHQCLPKPAHLTWEQAASYMLVGATAYRMLNGWPEHAVRPNDVVLIWGAAGGLGSMAIQITKHLGGVPIAVVSSDERGEYCKTLGARGYINRTHFKHWGLPPDFDDAAAYGEWFQGVRGFGRALWDALGERRNPRIVFEHTGQDTIPTSIFVCDNGGMVVTCAGTTGYAGVVDVRYLWMRQKRFQGSHLNNDVQAAAVNELVAQGKLHPAAGAVYPFETIGQSHQLMYENTAPSGKMVHLIGAARVGLRE